MTARRTQNLVGKATREQIIAVTLQAIQKEGLAALTIRQIAEQAGVNVAAVNYHFGSKDALVNEVLVELTAGLRHAFAGLSEEEVSARERLRRFLDEFSTVLLRYPEVYRQAIGGGLLGGDGQSQYLGFLRAEGLQVLKRLVREVSGETQERRLMLRIIQAISGLVYPLLVGPQLTQATGLTLSDERVRREHVALCLQNLVGKDDSEMKVTRRPAKRASATPRTRRTPRS
ncbi:TetR/AcrR family transcriptional regulator [Haliangium sp. UPWRP_2]|uniref:TetR/AcrR family transcriptional regulator n=1 Tax=Haliangium sp. UPWRP_2 TaxID=1931276 RepID=UPI000B547A1B|nr:TetR/AcrR family transcriptional regulator [Haliangium sp. UPWRP_2]PSM32144.1 TetR/AcrR family transcriptional regulator [Haliangium sp. UPWRP_2]HNN98130.1 TetR/AcrR family transcriptional regulator [Pseudomonadota bacterium]